MTKQGLVIKVGLETKEFQSCEDFENYVDLHSDNLHDIPVYGLSGGYVGYIQNDRVWDTNEGIKHTPKSFWDNCFPISLPPMSEVHPVAVKATCEFVEAASPKHYEAKYSPIAVIRDMSLGFDLGNVLKYIYRCTKKDGVRDIEKAIDYLSYCRRIEEHEYRKLNNFVEENTEHLTLMQCLAFHALFDWLFLKGDTAKRFPAFQTPTRTVLAAFEALKKSLVEEQGKLL